MENKTKKTSLIAKLNRIQLKLKVAKNNSNDFGKYRYRSCEDILLAVESLQEDTIVLLSDNIVNIGGFNYIEATATIRDDMDSISVTAYARESVVKKGMDDSQITGSASSYARKYALCGLFKIDGEKDADATNNQTTNSAVSQDFHTKQNNFIDHINKSTNINELKSYRAKAVQYGKEAELSSRIQALMEIAEAKQEVVNE